MDHRVRLLVLVGVLSSSRATLTAPAPPTLPPLSPPSPPPPPLSPPSPFGPPPFAPPPAPPDAPPPQSPPRSPPPPPPPEAPPPGTPPPLAPFATGEITFLDLPYLADRWASWWTCLWPGLPSAKYQPVAPLGGTGWHRGAHPCRGHRLRPPFQPSRARGLIDRSPLSFQPIRRVGATTSLNLLLNLTRELIWGAINITLPPGWEFDEGSSKYAFVLTLLTPSRPPLARPLAPGAHAPP